MSLSDHQSGSLLVASSMFGLSSPKNNEDQKEVQSERRLPFSITNILNTQVNYCSSPVPKLRNSTLDNIWPPSPLCNAELTIAHSL